MSRHYLTWNNYTVNLKNVITSASITGFMYISDTVTSYYSGSWERGFARVLPRPSRSTAASVPFLGLALHSDCWGKKRNTKRKGKRKWFSIVQFNPANTDVLLISHHYTDRQLRARTWPVCWSFYTENQYWPLLKSSLAIMMKVPALAQLQTINIYCNVSWLHLIIASLCRPENISQ